MAAYLILGAALAADAEYGEVVQVCFELIFLLEGDPDGLQEAMMVYIQGRTTVPADDVVVALVVSHLVLVGPTPEVYLDEQTLLFQQLDGAVDGSNVYERVCLLDLFVDILSSHVPRAGSDGGKNHHSLGVSLYPALLRELRRSSALVKSCAPGRECPLCHTART